MTRTVKIDEALKAYCTTERQKQYIDAVNEHKGVMAASKAMGVAFQTISEALSKIRARAAQAGHAPQGRAMAFKARPKMPGEGKRIMVIPDVQAKPGVDFSYLRRIGMYALEKRPDRLVCGGDFSDMPSLSSYDKGKKSFEGRRYKRDVESAQYAMHALLGPIREYNEAHPKRTYTPEMDLVLGNHENRTNRAVEDDAKLDGVLSIKDLGYEEFGWRVHNFLEVIVIEGVAFSHYFTSGVMGANCSTWSNVSLMRVQVIDSIQH